MTIWFTSDTHFCHDNIIKDSNRPFNNLEHMTEQLIENWNACVSKRDVIYHLGDFAYTRGKRYEAEIDRIMSRLRGQKFLIKGNHDKPEVYRHRRWAGVFDSYHLAINLGGAHKQKITLSHCSQRVWYSMQYGAWMLYGHSHGNLSDVGGKTIDVGVDVHNYRPISIYEVDKIMRSRKVITYDHHMTRTSESST